MVRIRDEDVKPAFTGNVRALSGRISHLSSRKNSPANFDIRATYDRTAPFIATGEASSLGQNFVLSANLSLKNLELTTFSTYAQKYAYVPIERGKFSLKTDVKIEDRTLNIFKIRFF